MINKDVYAALAEKKLLTYSNYDVYIPNIMDRKDSFLLSSCVNEFKNKSIFLKPKIKAISPSSLGNFLSCEQDFWLKYGECVKQDPFIQTDTTFNGSRLQLFFHKFCAYYNHFRAYTEEILTGIMQEVIEEVPVSEYNGEGNAPDFNLDLIRNSLDFFLKMYGLSPNIFIHPEVNWDFPVYYVSRSKKEYMRQVIAGAADFIIYSGDDPLISFDGKNTPSRNIPSRPGIFNQNIFPEDFASVTLLSDDQKVKSPNLFQPLFPAMLHGVKHVGFYYFNTGQVELYQWDKFEDLQHLFAVQFKLLKKCLNYPNKNKFDTNGRWCKRCSVKDHCINPKIDFKKGVLSSLVKD